MIIAFWIVAGITAILFFAVGVMKLSRPNAALASSGLAWVEDFNTAPVKLIGAAEVLGAVGLVVPMLTGILPVVSPIAGIALALLMLGAVATHARRHEPPIPLVLVALSVAAAVLGFIVL